MADHRDRKWVGKTFTQVDDLFGQGFDVVEKGRDDILDNAGEVVDAAGGQRRADQTAQPPVVGTVRREHVLHADPQCQRPALYDVLEVRPVCTAVLGDILALQQPLEDVGVRDGPGGDAKDVHADRGTMSTQLPVFAVVVGTGRVEDDRLGGLGCHAGPAFFVEGLS